MSAVSLTLLDGSAVSVEANAVTSVVALPAAMLPPTYSGDACRVMVGRSAYDVQGTQAAVSQTVTNGAGPSRVVLTNNTAVNATTLADIAGLSFPVVNGSRYYFYIVIFYTVAAATTGAAFAVNGPAATFLSVVSRCPSTVSTMNDRATGAYDTPNTSFSASASASSMAVIEGWVQPSADGTLVARGCSEIALTDVTIKAGSFIEWRKVA